MTEKTYTIYESKGQLKATVPRTLGQAFGLKKGTKVKWIKSGDNLLLVKV